jgi:hypothetical protein
MNVDETAPAYISNLILYLQNKAHFPIRQRACFNSFFLSLCNEHMKTAFRAKREALSLTAMATRFTQFKGHVSRRYTAKMHVTVMGGHHGNATLFQRCDLEKYIQQKCKHNEYPDQINMKKEMKKNI